MKNSMFNSLLFAMRHVRMFWLFGLIGFGIFTWSHITLKEQKGALREKEFRAYFPRNGEFRPDTAIIAQQSNVGMREANPTFAEIKVSVEEFGRLAETSPYQPLVSTKLDNQTYHRQIINYWLLRDGVFYYHAIDAKSLPNVDWGSIWFSTKWEHRSDDTWIATAVWEPTGLYVWRGLSFIFGWISVLAGIFNVTTRLLRRQQPSEA